MSSRVSLSSDERASILREIRSADDGEKVQVRTNKGSGKKGSGGFIHPPQQKRKKGRGRGFKRTVFVIATLLILSIGLLSAKVLKVGQNVLNPNRSIFAQLADLVIPGERKLAGEKENQINILLIGIGGKGHDGENLADTIMVAMIRPQEKEIALLSIPRDLFVRLNGSNSFTKINAVHAYNENKKPGQGPIVLREKVEEITGLPIQYYGRVDFTAFKKIVDEVGGVEITIPVSFYDYWHKISFPAGKELMNGERALSYVRARYVEGPEGGDFKRAARQQHLLLAIRDKVLSANTAFNLRAVSGILDALSENVATNFNLWEIKRLGDLVRDIPKENIHTAVLTTGTNGLLTGGTEILDGRPASIMRPRAGAENYTEIQAYVKNIFATKTTEDAPEINQTSAQATPSPSPSSSPSALPVAEEKPTVEIRNATNISGMAAKTSNALKNAKFTVEGIGNAAKRDRTTTVVIDLTGGKKPNSLKSLLQVLDLKTAATFPETEAASKSDFLILLGTDFQDKLK